MTNNLQEGQMCLRAPLTDKTISIVLHLEVAEPLYEDMPITPAIQDHGSCANGSSE